MHAAHFFEHHYPKFEGEIDALLARMTTRPVYRDAARDNKTVRRIKQIGIWSRFDGFYMFAAHDSQAARLNWCSNNIATATNSPTFTINKGYTGDGSVAYLDTGLADNAQPNFTQDSCNFGFYLNFDSGGTAYQGGLSSGNGVRLCASNGTNMIGRLHDAGGSILTNTVKLGGFTSNRAGSGAITFRRGLTSSGSLSVSSAVPTTSTVVFLKQGAATAAADGIAAGWFASSINSELNQLLIWTITDHLLEMGAN